MQLGVIGLGRMGANIARRLMRAGHECVVHDLNGDAVDVVAREGAVGAKTLAALVSGLSAPRAVWIMVPDTAVEATLAALGPLLSAGDVVIDGGNSHYAHDIRRASQLASRGVHYVDVGTSGGVWGLTEGYCLTIGGEEASVKRLSPIFAALSPSPRGPSGAGLDAEGRGEGRYLHCGPAGAGHFAKMVHNGIEYGVMAAYAEGFNLLRHGDNGRYDIDAAKVAEVWRHGSVIRSWLLDLIASALAKDPKLAGFEGFVSDSGEGRWAVKAAVDGAVPAPVLSAALFARFSSRGEDDFANRLLSAMRREFGGHQEPGTGGRSVKS
jgi:6-phosphogluconate dehydrogenase